MKRVTMAAALAAAAMMAAGTAVPARAATVVQEGGSTRGLGLLSYGTVGQSFTMIGTALTSFSFQFQTGISGANAPITFSLFDGKGFGGTVLKTITATPPAGAARANFWYDFDLGGLALTDGATYTAAVGAASTQRLGVVYNLVPTGAAADYTGGTLLSTRALPGGSPNCGTSACDANFRFTTTGTAGAVPEPASWAMLVLGFGAVGYTLRRRAPRVAHG